MLTDPSVPGKPATLWQFLTSPNNVFFIYIPAAVFFMIYLHISPLLNRGWLPIHDTLTQFTEFMYALAAFRNGELPLWNSYLYGGQPFYLLLTHGLLLNPVMWIWMFIGPLFSMPTIYIFAACNLTGTIIFGLGGFFLVKRLTGSSFAAVAAFIILLFSGEPDYWENQVYSFAVIEYVPWVLYLFLRYFDKQSLLNAFALTITTGIAMNMYYPVYLITFLMTMFFLLLIFNFRVLRALDYKKLLMHIFAALPLIALLLLPTYLQYSEITGANYQISRFTGPEQKDIPVNIVNKKTLDFTGALKALVSNMLVASRKYNETVPLIGTIPVVLLIITIGWASKTVFFWLSLFVLMWLNCLADLTPYPRISSFFIPFQGIIRSGGFFSGFVALPAVIFACYGIRHFSEIKLFNTDKPGQVPTKLSCFFLLYEVIIIFLPEHDRVINIIIFGCFLAGFIIISRYALPRTGTLLFKHLLLVTILIIGINNLVIVKRAIGKWVEFSTINYSMFSDSNKFNFSFVRPEKYDVVQPLPGEGECCATFYHIAERRDGPPFFDNWGSQQTLFVDKGYYHYSAIKGFEPMMKNKLHFFRYYTLVKTIDDYNLLLNKSVLALDSDDKVFQRTARVDAGLVPFMKDETIMPSSLSLARKTANTVIFNVSTFEPSIMLYTDLYHKGFIAKIDGREAALLKGMGVFKAVELPSGQHTVEFEFRPSYRYILMFYLAVSVGFVIFAALFGSFSILSKIIRPVKAA